MSTNAPTPSLKNLASEVPPPENYINEHSIFSFYTDPYVYYATYVANLLPKPPVIRHQTEMLYKYELLYGATEFMSSFDMNAPINPSTSKPFGADTQKFEAWAQTVRAAGKMPIHPTNAAIAHEAVVNTKKQMELGLVNPLPTLLEAKGQIGLQVTAKIGELDCYAYVDKFTDKGDIVNVMLIPSLDTVYEQQGLNINGTTELMVKISYQCAVLEAAGLKPKNAYFVLAEYLAPFRVSVMTPQVSLDSQDIIKQLLAQLSASQKSKDVSVWQSRYNSGKAPVKLAYAI